MSKHVHEIRDPIHVFVRLDTDERKVLNSRPFQRLRYIHQLALTYLVYPGATHRRFEHSLGVMELADRVFSVVTDPVYSTDSSREVLPPSDQLLYWRRVLRMAALCHDIGHFPFSHAAEGELLPEGWDHERMTREIISSEEMTSIWNDVTPPLRPGDIARIALGPKKAGDLEFSNWEVILSEIIVGDAFGVDRMDYLLRDSHHVGVAYGKFDHYRLIDTMRILSAPGPGEKEEPAEPALGVEEGGIQSAEALMLARYFMYSQVYLHHVRRIYDIHLKDFLKQWLDGGWFSTHVSRHLEMTDNEVTAALRSAAFDENHPGHLHAQRIVEREHFRLIYERNPADVEINPEAGQAILDALSAEYGPDSFRHDRYPQRGGAPDFPVRLRDDSVQSSLVVSGTLNKLPAVSVDYVFAERSLHKDAEEWLAGRREEIIRLADEEGEENG